LLSVLSPFSSLSFFLSLSSSFPSFLYLSHSFILPPIAGYPSLFLPFCLLFCFLLLSLLFSTLPIFLARRADNLTTLCKPIVKKMWEPQRLRTLWASTAIYSDSFTIPTFSFFLPIPLPLCRIWGPHSADFRIHVSRI
jgi:hypothetical protein